MDKKIIRKLMAILLSVCMMFGSITPVSAAGKKKATVKSVVLNKKVYTLKKNQTVKLKATINPSSAKSTPLVWTSSNKSVATVDAKGTVKAKKNGTAKITVKAKGTNKKAVCTIRVGTPVTKVKLNAKTINLAPNQSKTVKATLTPSKPTVKGVTFKSSDTKVATVNSKGKITAKKVGTATITAMAKDGTDKKATVKVVVTQPVKSITLSADKKILEVGETVVLKTSVSPSNAKNKAVTYTSSDKNIATVSSTGKVTALKAGKVTIKATAKDGSKKVGQITIEVRASLKDVTWNEATAKITRIEAGQSVNLGVNITPGYAQIESVKYTSSDESIAKATDDGQLIGLANGKVTVKATVKDKYGNTKEIELKDVEVYTSVTGLEIQYAESTVYEGQTIDLKAVVFPETASEKGIIYTTDNDKAATVDENGIITAVAEGVANIKAASKDNNQIAKICHVVVKPVIHSLEWTDACKDIDAVEVGSNATLSYKITPENADVKEVKFTSEKVEFVTVTQQGEVTAVKNGNSLISVEVTDGTGKKHNISKRIVAKTSVTELSVTEEEKIVYIDENIPDLATYQIVYSILPEAATNKNVTYKSDNEAVATVDETGLVRGIAEGTANITVKTVDGGFTKTIAVTVKTARTHAYVTTQEQLNTALANSELEVLTIKDATNIEIPSGEHNTVSLVVDSENGHIENNANFKDVLISAVGENTYKELARNTIAYQSKTGKIMIAPGASATVAILPGAEKLNLVNNGVVDSLTIKTQVDVSISGDSDSKIIVKTSAQALNTNIETSKQLDVIAEAQIKLALLSGAENTVVSVPTSDKKPLIKGLGRVEVAITDTSDVEFVVAENEDATVNSQKVSVSGTVTVGESGDNTSKVYLIPYKNEITQDNIVQAVDENTLSATTAADGTYKIDNVSIGNYYMLVQKEGYQDVLLTLIITSNNGAMFYVDTVYMVVDDKNAVGNATGTLINAKTGKPVEQGITVRIRKGMNDVSGEVVAATQTDATGKYSFINLPVGQYTAQIIDSRENSKEHYVSTSFSFVVKEGENEIEDNTATIVIDDEQMRIVLSWGDEESGASSDLDSHLVGPTADGKDEFHTYFGNIDYIEYLDENEESRIEYANLDVDDTTWEGPETTTIYTPIEGEYRFYIHDFSNGGSESSVQLSKSYAVVRVYVGAHLVETFSVPNQPGTLWYVCNIDAVSQKVTPVNTMSYWMGDTGDIGIDQLKKYKRLLKDQIDEAQTIIEKITDNTEREKLNTLVTEAVQKVETEDLDRIKELYNQIYDYISQCKNATDIDRIIGDTIDYYTTNEDGTWKNLCIYDYESLTPEYTVEFRDSETTYTTEKTGDETYPDKIIATAKNGYTQEYYVKYSISGNSLKIGDVQSEYLYDYDTDSNDDYYILYLYGNKIDLPQDLVISARYSKAQVSELMESDVEGYVKKFTISLGDAVRTYYVKWNLSSSALRIHSVSYKNNADKELITDYYADYYEDEIDGEYVEYDVLKIKGYMSEFQTDTVIKSRADGLNYEIKQSDKTQYQWMATISYGSYERKYYIEYTVDSRVLSISSIYAGTEDGGTTRLSFVQETQTIADKTVNVIRVKGRTLDVPEKWEINPYYDEDTVTLSEVESVEGYEGFVKKVTISNSIASKDYYLLYELSEDALTVSRVNAISDGYDMVYNYDIYSDETENNEKHYYLSVEGYTEELPENLEIKCGLAGATVEIKDSDMSGYQKMAVMTYNDLSRTYYIRYTRNLTGPLRVGDIYGDGENLSFTTEEQEINGAKVNVVKVRGWKAELPTEWIIYDGNYDQVDAAAIKDVEAKDGYENFAKVITLTYGSASIDYYMIYELSEDALTIKNVTDIVDDANMLTDGWYTEEEWIDYEDGGKYVNVLYLYGLLDELSENLVIESNLKEADVAIKESDMEAYNKMVEISYGDISRSYYIAYEKKSSDDVLNINTIWGDSYCLDFDLSEREINGETVNVITVKGITEELPTVWETNTGYSEENSTTLVNDVEQSEEYSEFAKVLTVKYGPLMRDYYMIYQFEVAE